MPNGPSRLASPGCDHQGRSICQSSSGRRLPRKTWCGGYPSASSNVRRLGAICSAASSRVGLDPWRTRSGAWARTSEQAWTAALMSYVAVARVFWSFRWARRALGGDTIESGGGSGWPLENGSSLDFPNRVRLDVGLEQRQRPLHDSPSLVGIV